MSKSGKHALRGGARFHGRAGSMAAPVCRGAGAGESAVVMTQRRGWEGRTTWGKWRSWGRWGVSGWDGEMEVGLPRVEGAPYMDRLGITLGPGASPQPQPQSQPQHHLHHMAQSHKLSTRCPTLVQVLSTEMTQYSHTSDAMTGILNNSPLLPSLHSYPASIPLASHFP